MATDEDRTNVVVQIGRHTVDSHPAAPPGPAIADAFELQPGTMLGEYRVERKLGEGGMGVVFAAVHPVIAKRAAIKILRRAYCANPITVERFVDEARVVNQISHPNIVDVFAFGELPDGRRYFVMEWLQGEPLRDRIARGPMPADEVCAVLRPLTLALSAGPRARGDPPRRQAGQRDPRRGSRRSGGRDAARFRHREARRARELRTDRRRRSDRDADLHATGAGAGLAIGPGVDTYALGATVFEMLTGRPPFVGETPMEVVVMHTTEAAPAPSAVSEVPANLDKLVVRMLAMVPAARPSLDEVGAVAESAT